MRPEGSRALDPGQAEALNQVAEGAISGKSAAKTSCQDGPKRLEHRAMQRLLQDMLCQKRGKQGQGRRGRSSSKQRHQKQEVLRETRAGKKQRVAAT